MSEGRGRGRGRGRGYDGDRGPPRGGGGPGVGRGRGEVEIFSQGGEPPRPAEFVTALENKTAESLKAVAAKAEASLPPRPAYGTAGRGVSLWANYFKMSTANPKVSSGKGKAVAAGADIELHRYSIEIRDVDADKEPAKKKKVRIVQILLEEQFSPKGITVASDFVANLIARNAIDLPAEASEPGFVVRYRGDYDEATPTADTFHVRVKPTGTLTLSQLIEYLNSTAAESILSSKEQIIQALNIVCGHHPKSLTRDIATVAQNRYFSRKPANTETTSLGGGLSVVRGYFMSVRPATGRLLVNVQVKNMAFFESGPLENLMRTWAQANGQNASRLQKFIKGLNVDTTHIVNKDRNGQRKQRVKTIFSLATPNDGRGLDHPPQVPRPGAGPKDVKFWLADDGPQGAAPSAGAARGGKKKKGKKTGGSGVDDLSSDLASMSLDGGKYISVFEFFKQKHGITISDPALPVVNVGSTKQPAYLPAQVCVVLSGQAARKKLSPGQTQQMIKFAVRQPALNARSIVNTGGKLLGFEPLNSTLSAFDISVKPSMITVDARELNAPQIKYANNRTIDPRFGSWNLADKVKFVAGTRMQKWTYLRLVPRGRSRDPFGGSDGFRDAMLRFSSMLGKVGINTPNFTPGATVEISGPSQNKDGDIEQQIDDMISKMASHPTNKPQLLYVVIPDDPRIPNTRVYNHIKYNCDVKHGILCVCGLEGRIARANDQYFANVALKVNLKLGGTNHSIDPSRMFLLKEKTTMLVGLDVTHPSPGSAEDAPSVAAIVANVDEWCGQWPCGVRVQTAYKEMVEGLDDLLEARLRHWQSKNGDRLPDNIVVFRDGVSEGQYHLVLENELPQLQSACRAVYPATKTKAGLPRISIAIVGKRHHTRFYPTNKTTADRGGNPRNGTVVDRGITESRNWDFFLQAHTAIQGTARPAHYYVVWDQVFRHAFQESQSKKKPGGVSTPLQARGGGPIYKSPADALEDLVHNMCYLFGRATKAVSVCPPAYYADLVCERARCYLSSFFEDTSSGPPSSGPGARPRVLDPSMVQIHDNVKNSMFYI